MSLEEKLSKARKDIKHNEMVQLMYSKMLEEAEKYYAEKIRKIDELSVRQLGICEWYKGKHPETTKTDIEIIEHMEELEKKYGDDF